MLYVKSKDPSNDWFHAREENTHIDEPQRCDCVTAYAIHIYPNRRDCTCVSRWPLVNIFGFAEDVSWG